MSTTDTNTPRGGAPIQVIQAMLGHKELSTTQKYTKLCPADLKAIHKKYHPREKLSRP